MKSKPVKSMYTMRCKLDDKSVRVVVMNVITQETFSLLWDFRTNKVVEQATEGDVKDGK